VESSQTDAHSVGLTGTVSCVLGAGKLSTGRSITDFMGWTLQEKRHPHRGLTPAERIEGMGLAANICITIMRANILCRGVVLQVCRVRLGLRGVHLQLLNGHASGVPEHPHRGRAVAERVGG
jgi:hypothetical protein